MLKQGLMKLKKKKRLEKSMLQLTGKNREEYLKFGKYLHRYRDNLTC